MIRVLRNFVLAGSLALVGAACGDDSEDSTASCQGGAFQACGGDVKGTWSVVDSCISGFDSSEDWECAEATGEVQWDMRGTTITFANGRAESPASPSKMTTTTRFPLSCVEEDGFESCDELSFPPGGVTCSGAEQCTCVATYEDEGEALSVTYTTSGNRLTFEDEDGETVTYEYCVQGNTLHLSVTEDGVTTELVAKRK